MSWAFKRQLFFIGVLVIFFGIFGFLIISPYVNKIPTCTDNIQNGNEAGVDCGGSCVKACTFQVDEISILWTRSFEIISGRYNAVAYLENHNKDTAVSKISYRFRFADKNNIYIGKREGETSIPPSGRFAVFEPGIGMGNSVPIYTTFEFTQTPTWTKVEESKLEQLKVSVSDIKLEDQNINPRISAVIKNDSLFVIPDVNIVAILYDDIGNAISVSSTFLEKLDREESKDISFTWREPIVGNIIAKEIIPIYDIFSDKLK